MSRLNILIVAHEFSPSQGSECAVGWNLVVNLCKYHNVTVIYAKTNQFKTSNYEDSVKDYFSKNQEINGLTLFSLAQPKAANFLVQINSKIKSTNSAIGVAPLYYTAYKAWQKSAFKVALNLSKKNNFNIVHQLTSISFREPGYLWKLDIPFVWGPCSGLVRMPTSFYRGLTIMEIGFEIIRRAVNYFQSNYSLRIMRAINKASIIYAVTDNDFNFFNSKSKSKIRQMLDVGSFIEDDFKSIKITEHKLKLIWIGRLVHTKALDILLYALSKDNLLNKKIELTIVGDGPLLNRYKNLAAKLKIINVNWLGNISHDQVFHNLKDSDALVHTSIKEATSAVVLEALTHGLPVICHDAFGMSYAVDETCGLKIPLQSPSKSINGFYNSINLLLMNNSLLQKLKKGALVRSNELSWKSMAETIARDYNEIHLENR
jgi:glycosyltransferase involved in cell wall biosynthesis